MMDLALLTASVNQLKTVLKVTEPEFCFKLWFSLFWHPCPISDEHFKFEKFPD